MRNKIYQVVILFLLISIPLLSADHFIWDTTDVVPARLWTAGCAPTSGTMVLNYWDWYSPIGKYIDYGRIVPFYFEGYVISNYSDSNGYFYQYTSSGDYGIPYTIYPLAWGMNTDANSGGTSVGYGKTNIEDGILFWTNTLCGYSFSSTEDYTSWNFGAIWNTIQTEVDNNKPCIWSRNGSWPGGPSEGHSVAVIGYDDDGNVCYRSTWDLNYNWSSYQGNGETWEDITTVTPGGGSGGNDIELFDPDGGDTLTGNYPYSISWYQWGTSIDTVYIYYSTDRGYSWSYIGVSSSSQGWNSYSWNVPNISCSDAFVLIDAYSSGDYIAGEGSEDRFTIKYTTSVPNISTITLSDFIFKIYPLTMLNNLTIEYSVPEETSVHIKIYNFSGRIIYTTKRDCSPGYYSIKWNRVDNAGKKLPSGIYFIHFSAGKYKDTKKMIILK